MKKLLFVVLLVSTLQLYSQEETGKFDFRFGIGVAFLGPVDMKTVTFENELNYKLSNYFAASLSVDYGKSFSGIYESASYLQGNLNLFISPFRNNRKNDFRVGAGFSLMNVSETYGQAEYCGVGLPPNYTEPLFDNRDSFGYNIIIEDVYNISKKFLVGLKLFTQPYTNEDINSGVLVKAGFLF